MDILIRSTVITDSTSPHNGQTLDLLIRNGKIEAIGKALTNPGGVEEFSAEGLHISPGFMDLQANFRDPGHEYKENLESGAAAALRGGFTKVCVQSSTTPAIDNKAQVDYVRRRAQQLPVDILPIGALTAGRDGNEMAELYDMHAAGAIAFSDDKRPVENPKLFELILDYARNFNGLVIHYADTPKLSRNTIMHEGETSVFLGLKGVPSIAEEIALNRDIYILGYTGGKLHYSLLTTSRSMGLVKAAKKEGLQITAGTAAHYLLLDDAVMTGFDSVHKVKPPYRTEADIADLKAALKDGTLDIICSDHSPEDVENKRCELEQAAFGIIALETCFAAARTALKDTLDITQLVDKLAIRPRQITGIEIPTIREGQSAEVTLFQPDAAWTCTASDIRSLSDNSPFLGYTFTGRVAGVYHKGNFHRN